MRDAALGAFLTLLANFPSVGLALANLFPSRGHQAPQEATYEQLELPYE